MRSSRNTVIWPVGQAAKTSPSQGENMGSIPVRVTTANAVTRHAQLVCACFFCLSRRERLTIFSHSAEFIIEPSNCALCDAEFIIEPSDFALCDVLYYDETKKFALRDAVCLMSRKLTAAQSLTLTLGAASRCRQNLLFFS